VERRPEQSTRDALLAVDPADAELLGRLVLAEATSTGFADDPAVHRAIAWGVMNRVRLAERSATAVRWYGRGVRGVVFQPSQFNPAISTRSRFSRLFLCPADAARWDLATAAAAEALGGSSGVAVARTAAEQAAGLDGAVNFYYPSSEQARGPDAPWEGDLPRVTVTVDGVPLDPAKVVFYRLSRLPGDLR
jgi:hypothetical protein